MTGGDAAPVLRAVPATPPRRIPASIRPPAGPLVGRHAEVDLAVGLVSGEALGRLVTVTGPGGVGKTRLATEVAVRTVDVFDGAVLYVPLGFVSQATAVPEAIAGAARWDVTGAGNALDAVAAELGDRPALLVLDNCEQVDGLTGVVTELLAACPELTILATSRRALDIAGEAIVTIEPLPVPAMDAPWRTVAANDAVTVLTSAARRRDPEFTVTRDNAATLAQLCARLDGLPLALELAAARLHLISPPELLELLDRRFEVLQVPGGDRIPHHRQLWTTIDWSYRLLEPDDQRRFRTLGVFADGFTLAHVAAVTGDDPVAVLDTLTVLVDHHLVRSLGEVADARRFDLLESIREFARAELAAHDELDAAATAHAAWATELAERSAKALIDGSEQDRAMAVLDAERDNLRAALRWQLAAGRRDAALRLATGLWRYWWKRGATREGLDWFEAAFGDRTGERAAAEFGDRPHVADALTAFGDLSEAIGDLPAAAAVLANAAAMYERLADRVGLAGVWNSLAFVERELGNVGRARQLHIDALAVYRETGDRRAQAVTLSGLANVAFREGDNARSTEYSHEVLAILDELGDRHAAAIVLGNLGIAQTALGDFESAADTHRRTIALAEELGDEPTLTNAYLNLADALIGSDQLDAATEANDRAAQISAETGNHITAAVALFHRARIAAHRGRLGEALGLHVTGIAATAAHGHVIKVAEYAEQIALLVAELGDEQLARRCVEAATAARVATGTTTDPQTDALLTARGLEPGGSGPDEASPAELVSDLLDHLHPELVAFADEHAGARREPAPSRDPLRELGLTAREAEVARLVSARLTDREIAERLYIGGRTVGTHVSAVLRKLGLRSRRDVAARLAEFGID